MALPRVVGVPPEVAEANLARAQHRQLLAQVAALRAEVAEAAAELAEFSRELQRESEAKP